MQLVKHKEKVCYEYKERVCYKRKEKACFIIRVSNASNEGAIYIMTNQELYNSKCMSADRALELIRDGDHIFSAQATAEPIELMSHLQHLKETGVKDCRLSTCLPLKDYPCFHDKKLKEERRWQTI